MSQEPHHELTIELQPRCNIGAVSDEEIRLILSVFADVIKDAMSEVEQEKE